MDDVRTYCIRRFLEGATYTQIGNELGPVVSRAVVAGHLHRARADGREIPYRLKAEPQFRERKPKLGEPPPMPPCASPPSAAMIRLAKFDPVIARAVELRRSLAA